MPCPLSTQVRVLVPQRAHDQLRQRARHLGDDDPGAPHPLAALHPARGGLRLGQLHLRPLILAPRIHIRLRLR